MELIDIIMISKLFLTRLCVWFSWFSSGAANVSICPLKQDSFKAWHQSHESRCFSRCLSAFSEKFSAFGGMGVKQWPRKRSLSSWSDESSKQLTETCVTFWISESWWKLLETLIISFLKLLKVSVHSWIVGRCILFCGTPPTVSILFMEELRPVQHS